MPDQAMKTPILGLPAETWGLVAVDTETSGLHPDDGATIAAVSVAWYELNPDGSRGQLQARAYPFDQERWEEKGEKPPKIDKGGGLGKRKAGTGQETMFSLLDLFEDPNLDRDAWDELIAWLLRRWLVMHNGKFDLTQFRNGVRRFVDGTAGGGIDLEPRVRWDTMLVASKLDPTELAGLKPTAERLWGESERAEQNALKRYLDGRKRYDLVPWDTMEPYARRDADQTLRLWLHQRYRVYGTPTPDGRMSGAEIGRLERDGLAVQHQLMRTLLRIEQRGIPYDAERSGTEAMKVRMHIEPLRAKLAKAWGREPTGAAAVAWFYGRHGAKPRMVMKNGVEIETRPTDAEEARFWARAGIPWAVEWGQLRRMETAASMWYEGYAQLTGLDGRIRTEFKQTRVKSGRMAVGRWQAQAIPKKDKRSGVDGVAHPRELLFTGPAAIPGWASYNLDLSQAELRVAALLSGCTTMVRMLNAGADLHSVTTESVFKQKQAETEPAEWKRIRDIAKRLTFGSIFWVGGRTFQATLRKEADLEWTLGACNQAVYAWRDTYPEFGIQYYDRMREFERNKRLKLVSGRYTHLGRWDYPRSGWNRIVQGSLAEFVAEWLNDVEEQTREWHPRGGLVLTVHDSAVLYLPTEVGDVLVPQLAKRGGEMATAYFGTPMKVDHGRWLE